MDQDRNKNPGGSSSSGSGMSGWSPTSQPGPASGGGSISQGGSAGGSNLGSGPGSNLGREIGQQNRPGVSSGYGNTGHDSGGSAKHLREQAMERGSGMLHQVQDKVSQGVEQGKGRIAEEISAMGGALKEAAGKLEDRDSGVGRYARMAAEQIDGLADFVRDADPNQIGRDIQRFARQRPEIFLGGAVIAGLLIGRFLRSHEPRRRFDRDLNYSDIRDDFDSEYSGDFESTRINRGYAAATSAGTSGVGYGSTTGSTPARGTGFSTTGGSGGTGYGAPGAIGRSGSQGSPGFGDTKGGNPRPSGQT